MSFLPEKFYFDKYFGDLFDEGSFKDMKFDIYEHEGNTNIEMDMPGFNKEDISINLDDGYLTIEATRDSHNEDKKKNYIRQERSFGKISRKFYVGNIDESSVNAEFENGVLKVVVPQVNKTKNKKTIKIK